MVPTRSRPARLRLGLHRTRPFLGLLAVLVAAGGCAEERNAGSKPKGRANAKAKLKAPEKLEFIVGKRTQEIKNAGPELQQGDARVATTKITAKDPITLQGNAYVTSIGRIAIMQIEQAINLYHAANDRYPKDYEEFMSEIIKANNIGLPQLPYYQKYGYDEKEHKLIVLEYPELKDQPLPR